MVKETEKGKETEKDKALELAIAQIEKQFGKGSIMKLGKDAHVPVDVIPGHSCWCRRRAPRPGHRGFRTGIQRQDHHLPPYHR
jgi:hypothetical protein